MAPLSGGQHLAGAVARNLKTFKTVWKKTHHFLQTRLPGYFVPLEGRLQTIPVRSGARHPIHPAAYLKQIRSRFHSVARRSYSSSPQHAFRGVKYAKSSFPTSRTATAVAALTGRAPFASTLRPNLTGGTLGRTAGGYSLGSGRIGGQRFFSHGPAAPSQVVQNVSQAVRAFYLGGKKAQFDGTSPRTGEKRYKAVTPLQHSTSKKLRDLPKATPGSYIDFHVNPTITALTPLSAVTGYEAPVSSEDQLHPESLNSNGLLDVLSADFSRALKDLAAVLNDLKKLSALGDLPITYRGNSALRVHFPGTDAESVEQICLEMDVQRGVVVQDVDFDAYVGTEIALLFPFAPSKTPSEVDDDADSAVHELFTPAPRQTKRSRPPQHIHWQDMFPSSSEEDEFSTKSNSGRGFDAHDDVNLPVENPWLSSIESSPGRDFERVRSHGPLSSFDTESSPLEYRDDFEGIYRFIELCDENRR